MDRSEVLKAINRAIEALEEYERQEMSKAVGTLEKLENEHIERAVGTLLKEIRMIGPAGEVCPRCGGTGRV